MKWILVMGIVFISGCGLRQREMELNRKMQELNVKEQELALKEQSLSIKEEQLNEKEKSLDSTKNVVNDSLFVQHQKLPGTWMVEMQCTETNCPGSAVGDVKNEQWDFKFQNNMVIASAMSNNQLVRVYTGDYVGNTLKLSVQQDSTDASAKIIVRLQQTKDKEMTGDREITQANGCRILYSLRLKKQ
ncbi:MAG: hypothetical protein ACTHKY_15185 [Ginsengibacter sp.]|jgi:hypothetical protein